MAETTINPGDQSDGTDTRSARKAGQAMTEAQIAALEALAQAATPYWSEDYSRLEDILICGRDDSKEYAATVCHVRAANPAAILALIRRLREAEADALAPALAEARAVMDTIDASMKGDGE